MFVGPLFFFEIIKMGRKGWNTILRCLYALVLLVVLFLIYQSWAGWPGLAGVWSVVEAETPNQLARLSQDLISAVLITQVLAVFFLAPLYVGGAIIEERNRGTLQLLFTSHLTNREILLGKMMGRVAAIGSLLLTSLPVLAIIQFWGGVSFYVTGAAFVSLFIFLITAGAISIHASVHHQTYASAVFHSYWYMFLLTACCSSIPYLNHLVNPIYFIFEVTARSSGDSYSFWGRNQIPSLLPDSPLAVVIQLIIEFALFQGLIALYFLTGAIRRLRNPKPKKKNRKIEKILPKKPDLTKPPYVRMFPLPNEAVGSKALWWKEVEAKFADFSSTINQGEGWLVMGMVIVFLCHLIWFLVALGTGQAYQESDLWNPIMRFVFVLLLSGIAIEVGVLSASTVSQEKEKGTLEILLTVPLERKDILWTKWLGNIWRFQALGILGPIFLLVEMFMGVFHPFATLLMVPTICVYLLFMSSLGLYLSLACSSTLRACLTLGGILGGVIIGSMFLELTEWSWLQVAINPIYTWHAVGFSWEEWQQYSPAFSRNLSSIFFGLAVYGSLALILWEKSWRLFRSEETWFLK